MITTNFGRLYDLFKILEHRIDSQDDELSQTGSYGSTTDVAASFVENELQQHYKEKNMVAGRTQWVDMCFTSVALSLVAMLRKV